MALGSRCKSLRVGHSMQRRRLIHLQTFYRHVRRYSLQQTLGAFVLPEHRVEHARKRCGLSHWRSPCRQNEHAPGSVPRRSTARDQSRNTGSRRCQRRSLHSPQSERQSAHFHAKIRFDGSTTHGDLHAKIRKAQKSRRSNVDREVLSFCQPQHGNPVSHMQEKTGSL